MEPLPRIAGPWAVARASGPAASASAGCGTMVPDEMYHERTRKPMSIGVGRLAMNAVFMRASRAAICARASLNGSGASARGSAAEAPSCVTPWPWTPSQAFP